MALAVGCTRRSNGRVGSLHSCDAFARLNDSLLLLVIRVRGGATAGLYHECYTRTLLVICYHDLI